MKARMPKSLGPTTKPSQEKAEKQAAQSAGDEAANMLESAEANIIPFEPTPEPVSEQPVDDSPVDEQPVDEQPGNAEPPITSEAEPGKAAVDAGEGVTFQSVADGYAPRGSGQDVPEKPAHVLMYERCLAEATEQHLQAALHREGLQGELKAAKDAEKAALALVSKIIAGGPERYEENPRPVPKSEQASETTDATDSVTSSQPENAGSQQSDAWRTAKLAELGLKPKLEERLQEAGIDTIGELEDLRAAIANGKKEWPKGIGAAKITAIEEAVLNWLENNQPLETAEEAASVTVAPVDTPADTITPTAEDIEPDTLQASPEQYPSIKTWLSWTEKAQTKWIEARAEALLELIHAGEDPDLPEELQAIWDKGVDARADGDTLENCELPPGPEMDAWIRGYLSAAKFEAQEEEQEAGSEPEPELATTAAASSSPSPSLFELDDLDDL